MIVKLNQVNDVNNEDLLEAIEYRVRELEWEISDRFFNAPIERYRIRRILKKHGEHLKSRDAIFAEWHHLTLRLNRARALVDKAVRNMMSTTLNQPN